MEETLNASALVSQLKPRIVRVDEGPAFWFLNTLCTVKATTESTGGSFSMMHHVAPGGFATPYHLHHYEDEAFYVLDGEHTFICDGERTVLGPGGFIFLPRRIPHGFRIDGPAPAAALVLATPGNEFAGMMKQMSAPATERILPFPKEPDLAKLTRFCERHGIDIWGPLPYGF